MKIHDLLESYSLSIGIPLKHWQDDGTLVWQSPIEGDQLAFCQLVSERRTKPSHCQHSSLYGGRQAATLGESYMYFCPCSLVHWAAAFRNGHGQMEYVVAGPVLLHAVDPLLLEDTRRRYPAVNMEQARSVLERVPVVSPKRLRHLASLLDYVVRNCRGHAVDETPITRQRAALAEMIHQLKEDAPALNGGAWLHEQEQRLVGYIRDGANPEARQVLNEILGQLFFQDPAMEALRARAMTVMAVLARSAVDAGAHLETIFGLQYRCVDEVLATRDVQELSEVLIRILDAFMDETFHARSMRSKDLFFRAVHFIREHHSQPLNLDVVAAEVGLSSAYFSRLFKEQVGLGFSDYLARVRVEAAKALLRQGMPIADVSQQVGYSDQSYFSKVFKKLAGESPRKWVRHE